MVGNKPSTERKVLILAIVLFALVVALDVTIHFSTPKNTPIIDVLSTEEPSVVPSPSNEISDWKTYKNEKYGFQLTFPDNWGGYKVNDKGDLIEFSLKRKNSEVINDTKAEDYGAIFAIKAYSKDEWKGIFESLTNVSSQEDTEKTRKESEKIKQPQPVYAGENENYIFGYVKYLKKAEDEELFEVYNPTYDVNTKIIPTFKFTGKELSDGWKNYQNKEYGYEIKYPGGLFSLDKYALKDGAGREYNVFYEYTHYWNLRKNPWVPYPFFNGIGINIPEKINGIPVKAINDLDEAKDELIKEEDKMGQWFYDFEKITFQNGISALRMYRSSNKESSYIYYIKIKNKIARIVVVPDNEPLDRYEKIISTLIFKK
ncbi:MAG: hypothetical protein WC788_08830 [Candidatus Paceibacterota bacterium]|jgi:hypothetical protein